MSNVLERYFKEASRRIPTDDSLADLDLPRPDYPEQEGFDPVEIEAEGHEPLTATGRDAVRRMRRHMAGAESSPLSDDERGLLDGGIRRVGFDVLAFFKSRRDIGKRPYKGKWGIFYLEQGLVRVKELIEEAYPGYGDPARLAHDFLREHERFHFKFDLYALSAEAQTGRSLYSPLKRAFRNHRIHQVEEALANRDAWEWAKRASVGISEFAYDFMKLQPGGYARFEERRFDLAAELGANLLDLNLSRTARREDQALWVGNIPEELLRRSLCPEYFVEPRKLTTWINPAYKLPKVGNVIEPTSFANSLDSKYATLRKPWEDTKRKLKENPARPGLRFKPWKATGLWSVRINDSFRAHLRLVDLASGTWEAQEIGPHTAMGHG